MVSSDVLCAQDLMAASQGLRKCLQIDRAAERRQLTTLLNKVSTGFAARDEKA